MVEIRPELWATLSRPLKTLHGQIPADATPQVTLHENVIARKRKPPAIGTYPETRTAWRTPIRETEVVGQANKDWDVDFGQKRIRRLPCLVLGLLIITVIMLLL